MGTAPSPSHWAPDRRGGIGDRGGQPPRREQLLALLTAGDPDIPLVQRVCEVSAAVLGVSGAGMCLIGGRSQQIVVHGTTPVAEALEDLQVDLGQGPCLLAVRTGSPTLVPDLDAHQPGSWPVFAERTGPPPPAPMACADAEHFLPVPVTAIGFVDSASATQPVRGLGADVGTVDQLRFRTGRGGHRRAVDRGQARRGTATSAVGAGRSGGMTPLTSRSDPAAGGSTASCGE